MVTWFVHMEPRAHKHVEFSRGTDVKDVSTTLSVKVLTEDVALTDILYDHT